MQWHQLDHMQTICTSLQTDNHTNSSSVNVYRPNALPDAQPTVSSTEGEVCGAVIRHLFVSVNLVAFSALGRAVTCKT